MDRDADLPSDLLAKVDGALRQALAALHYDPSVALPVIVELESPTMGASTTEEVRPSREQRLRQAEEKEALFAEEVTDFVRSFADHGATDVRPSWLGRSVTARAALPAIEVAARRPETRRILLDVRRPVVA